MQRLSRRGLATAVESAPKPGAALGLQRSVLPNNVICATMGPEREMVTAAVSLACGSRYELPSAPGTAHFLKHALFMTNQQESSIAMTRLQELRGALLAVDASRDLLRISVQCPRDELADTMRSVGFMLHPRRLEDHEVELVARNVQFDRNVLYSDPQTLLAELAQSVAFRSGMGNSPICSAEYEAAVTPEAILELFVRSMVHQGTSAVAVGVAHDVWRGVMAAATDRLHFSLFGSVPYMPPKYCGGEARLESSGALSHAVAAFPLKDGFGDVRSLLVGHILEKLLVPSQPVPHADAASLLTRAAPLAGIASFTGAAHLYSNGGLLTLGVSGRKGADIKHALQRIKAAAGLAVAEEDLQRAKTKALLGLRQAYEEPSRFTRLAAEQIAGAGSVCEWDQVQKAAASISLDHVRSALKEALSAKPTLVSLGNLREMPYLDEL